MKKVIVLQLVLISLTAFSQPVITTSYNPIYGDIYVYKIVDDTSTAQHGQAGAGVVWNLAAMHGQLTTRQYNWKQTALTNDAAIFGANSNIAAEIIQNGFSARYEYYNNGSSFLGDLRKIGTHVDLSITNFGGGFMSIDYPLSYGQSCTDSMIGSTGVAYVNGRSTTTYDGYGTLQLEAQSGGNFANVARLKIVEDYIVNYGPIETHHVETYYWMDHTTANMTKQPIAIIMTHDWVDLNGTTQREKIALMRQILFQNSVPQLSLNESNVSLFPNPFENKVSIALPGMNSFINIEISDITGRQVKNILLEKSMANRVEEINLNDLNEGLYLAKISADGGSIVKRIVKN
ncbi:MAG: T9SS type A sorting domain-containing protein [Bacteroidetes bacterium]|nr:T9SS type A sorting domain-containing protein [Bacteroidota bacterium]